MTRKELVAYAKDFVDVIENGIQMAEAGKTFASEAYWLCEHCIGPDAKNVSDREIEQYVSRMASNATRAFEQATDMWKSFRTLHTNIFNVSQAFMVDSIMNDTTPCRSVGSCRA